MPTNPPPIEEVLPHRGSMLLAERVLDWDAQQVALAARADAAAWYAEARGMPSWIGVELMAQAIAAHVGLLARDRGETPLPGVLLGTRAYRAKLAHLPAGAALTVHAKRAYVEESGLGAYDGRI